MLNITVGRFVRVGCPNAVYIYRVLPMNDAQYEFFEQLALRIPRLFEAISLGNIKSEYIIGLRRIGHRDVRLKLVAEVVDPGPNPLVSHGTRQTPTSGGSRASKNRQESMNTASAVRRPRKWGLFECRCCSCSYADSIAARFANTALDQSSRD